jgi:hypothetical protein
MNPRGSASLVGSGSVSRDFAWLEHAADKMGTPFRADRPEHGELWCSRQSGDRMCVRGNQAGVDGEPIGSDQPFGQAALDDGFEQMAQQLLSRKRPCRFLEKVEWSGTLSFRPRRQNQR